MSRRLTSLSLFAGIGATAHALRDIVGTEVVGAVEWAPPKGGRPSPQAAAETLRRHGFPVVNQDVRSIDWGRFGRVDIVTGGPPCQPFSQGGRNGGHTDERDCVPDYIAAVAELRPRLFVMENVRGLAGPRHRAYLDARLEELRWAGYEVDHRVLDASDYRVAQARKRLFVIGVRTDLGQPVRWPAKAPRKITMAEALRWDALETWHRNQAAPEAARLPRLDRRWQWPLERPAPTVVGSFRPDVAAAPGYRNAGDGPRQNAPGSVVTTLEERLVLQGLPRDWEVAGSKAQRDLQVGNTCPPLLMAALLEANLRPGHGSVTV